MFTRTGFVIASLFFILSTMPETAAGPVRIVPNKVDALFLADGYLVLDDQVFLYNSSTIVYRANGGLGTANDLRPGMRVIIQVLPPSQPSHKPVLVTIRIQP